MTSKLWDALELVADAGDRGVAVAKTPRGGGISKRTATALADRGLVVVDGRAWVTDAGCRALDIRARSVGHGK